MKAVIAAAGRGTRMKHLSQNKPKHLISVNGRPWMSHVFDNMRAAGIKDIILVVGYQAEAWDSFLKNETHDLSITVVNQFKKMGEDRYGTAVPVECVEDVVGGDDFLFFYGDNVYAKKDFTEFLNADRGQSCIGGMRHEDPNRFGVLFEEGGILKNIVEKPEEFIGDLINVGIYRFTPDIFDVLKKIELSPRGEYELTDAVSLLAQEKQVKVIPVSDYWMDFGRPEDVEKSGERFS